MNVDAIRQGDKVTRIGDNVNLANIGVQIAADFPSIHTIGANVTLGNFDGSLRFSNNAVFDNLTIKATTPPAIFCKNAIFRNCKLKNYNIVGDIAELHNVELTTADFNKEISVLEDADQLYSLSLKMAGDRDAGFRVGNGSGDVLTGMIGSFVSQGMSAEDAAKCGVYLHGLAADHCAQRLGQAYMQPNDILQDMGEILQ